MARSSKPMLLYPELFEGLVNLQVLHVYDPRLCCIRPVGAECVNREPPHPLFTCRKTFLQNTTIKVFIWILGLSALVGNAFVIIMRLRTKHETTISSVQSTLITNLAVSDFLMGVYMIILAVMDIYIGDSYFWEGRSEEWRKSNTCQIAGFISVLSSEASVFLITLISVDRFICIVFPFSQKRLGVVSARVFSGFTWALALVVSSISVAFGFLNTDAYSLSDVCVGLPLIRKQIDLYAAVDTYTKSIYGFTEFAIISGTSIPTWQYAIALFLGVNLLSFVVICLCYIAVFIKVYFAGRSAGRKSKSLDQVKMASKMFLIVGTDLCCWMPIIVIGILVQANVVVVTPDIYAWLVVFVLPINSSINPYLYTVANRVSSK
ncbi:G-protein coupled receptor GRL101-like [Lytechinus variegatus]|uniref:G-protein coupled receptor GRL101-like n=1 Tax=Lytechinus variegatus TaxID=7654 RepID=UPI001BB25B69|nr:G-protein coupled receptor GRL101-like [Lytechinus variegatus]